MRIPQIGILAAALILSGGVAVNASARSLAVSNAADSQPVEFAQKSAIAGLPNFGEVTPTLFRGAQPTAQGFRKLKEMNFDIVVDFRPNHSGERRQVTSLGMEYVSIPWNCYQPNDKDIAQFIAFLRAHPGKKIFIHCREGIDRTGMEVAAYRIIEQGWSDADARKEMDAFGFSRFHQTICAPLVSYQAHFLSRYHTRQAFEELRSQPPSATSSPAK